MDIVDSKVTTELDSKSIAAIAVLVGAVVGGNCKPCIILHNYKVEK